MSELLSDEEVAVLNAARSVLDSITRRASEVAHDLDGHEGWRLGRLAECSERGAHGIFQTLNCASSYNGVDLTADQLHNRA